MPCAAEADGARVPGPPRLHAVGEGCWFVGRPVSEGGSGTWEHTQVLAFREAAPGGDVLHPVYAFVPPDVLGFLSGVSFENPHDFIDIFSTRTLVPYLSGHLTYPG